MSDDGPDEQRLQDLDEKIHEQRENLEEITPPELREEPRLADKGEPDLGEDGQTPPG